MTSDSTTDQRPQEPVSKSQRKRDSKALQALGAELVDLPAHQCERLELPDELAAAIDQARTIKPSAARNRQIKYISGLLRSLDVAPIRAALDRLHTGSVEAKAQLHRIERWRERLLTDGDAALSALLAEWPAADRQRIRQLVRTARREAAAGKPPHAARALFRLLRGLSE